MRLSLCAAILLAACGAAGEASEPPPATSQGGGESEGNQQSSAQVAEGPPTGPEWQHCEPERAHGMGAWIPVPPDATIHMESDACIVHAPGTFDPEHADWLVALLFRAEGATGEDALLAIEPDGARRFVIEGAELRDVVESPERRMVFLGSPATLYTMRGRSDELGGDERIISATRVRLRGGIVAGIVVTRPGIPGEEALHQILDLARAH